MNPPADATTVSVPRIARRQQQRAIATRAKIIVESAKAFDISGYSATSTNEVLVSANLTKGALFYHFSSKEAVAQHLVQTWATTVEAAFAQAITADGSPARQLRIAFHDLAQRIENDLQIRAGMKLTLEPEVEGAYQAYRQWIEATSGVVSEGISNGSIDDTVEGHRLAWNLCAGFAGAVNAVPVLREDVDLSAHIDDLLTAHLSSVCSTKCSDMPTMHSGNAS